MIPKRTNAAWLERTFWGISAVSFLLLFGVLLGVLLMGGWMPPARDPVRAAPAAIAVPTRLPGAPAWRQTGTGAAPDAPAAVLPTRQPLPAGQAGAGAGGRQVGPTGLAAQAGAAPDAPAAALPGEVSWSDLDPVPDMALRAALLDAWQCVRRRTGAPPLVADPMLDMLALDLAAAWQRAGNGGAVPPLPPGIAEALLGSMPPEIVPTCADPWPEALPAPPSAAARRVGLVVLTPRADVLLHERVVTVVMLAQEDHP